MSKYRITYEQSVIINSYVDVEADSYSEAMVIFENNGGEYQLGKEIERVDVGWGKILYVDEFQAKGMMTEVDYEEECE